MSFFLRKKNLVSLLYFLFFFSTYHIKEIYKNIFNYIFDIIFFNLCFILENYKHIDKFIILFISLYFS